jgi:hypothetical protein
LDERWKECRDRLVEALELLMLAAESRNESSVACRCRNFLKDLEDLEPRVSRNQLPLGRINGILRDIRLDAITMFTDLRLAVQFEFKELQAPTEKLRQEVHRLGTELNKGFSKWAEERCLEDAEITNELNTQLKHINNAKTLLDEVRGYLMGTGEEHEQGARTRQGKNSLRTQEHSGSG